MTLDIRVCHHTEVLRDGEPLDLGGRKPAEVLALLVAAEGAPLDAEVLADRLWRGAPPRSAATTLQGHVLRLRRALEPGRSGRDATVVVRRGSGYALDVPREAVDVHAFVDAVEQAHPLVESDPAAAATLLQHAIARCGGTPFADVADVLEVVPVVSRLDQLRVTAQEDLGEAFLRSRQLRSAVATLARTAAENPLRERAHLLLAEATYHDGRQTEALDVLRAVRSRLADELGLDPSPDLVALEASILRRSLVLEAAPARDDPGSRADPAGPHLVGRHHELDVMRQVAAGARAGRPTAIVLTGEPGIGKTSLVEQLAGEFPGEVRTTRCLDSPGQPPYWPWQQVLGGLPETAEASDAGARFAFATEVVRHVERLASAGPLMLVLDDLQWCDRDSLHVLTIVLGQLTRSPVLVALTCREDAAADPAVSAGLLAASRLPGARRIAVGPLSEASTLALVRDLVDATDQHATDVARRSGGNPFFAKELAGLAAQPGQTSVPGAVSDVIRARTAHLDGDVRLLLCVVALVGREVSLSLAAAAGGLVGDPVDLVDQALATGLLVEPSPGRLRVRHDLVRESLVAGLSPGDRRRIHRGIADALEDSSAVALSRAEIAFHRSEGAAGALDHAAADACLLAAREALERSGADEAVDLAQRGMDHCPAEESGLRADLLETSGAALRRLGRIEESSAALRAAADLARSLDDMDRLARAALTSAGGGVGGYWASAGSILATDAPLLEEAAAHADRLEAPVANDVLAALAVYRSSMGVDARDIAQRVQSSGTARARVAGFVSRWTPAHADDRVRQAREMLAAARGHAVEELTALHLLRCALMEVGDADECHAVSQRLTEQAVRHGDGDVVLLDTWWRSGYALARGDMTTARSLADEAVAAATAASPAAHDVNRAQRQTIEGIIAWHERSLSALIPEAVDLAHAYDTDWLLVVAQAHAQAGRRDLALRAADRVVEAGRDRGAREPVQAILLADVYLELGDAERAAALLPRLESYGDSVVVLWPGTTILGPTAVYRGGIKALLGRPDAARDLETAVAIGERFGFSPFVERARRYLGR